MIVLVQAFLNIALRKQGPEDLPASSLLLALTLLISTLIQIPLTWLVFRDSDFVAKMLILDISLLLGCLWLLLRLTGYLSRYRQTLTALLGTSALLSVFSIPFVFWNASVAESAPKPIIPSAFILVIVIWSIVVDSHILSRALSKPFAVGLMITLAYFFLHTQLLVELMPVAQ